LRGQFSVERVEDCGHKSLSEKAQTGTDVTEQKKSDEDGQQDHCSQESTGNQFIDPVEIAFVVSHDSTASVATELPTM